MVEGAIQTDHLNSPLGQMVMNRLGSAGIRPNEKLGQHFLIDQTALDLVTSSVTPGNNVIEIGSGVGQLTEALAQRAARVIGVELDTRYKPVLEDIQRRHSNVHIVYGDALALRWQDALPKRAEVPTQLVGNIPYHISEPLVRRVVRLPLENVVFLVGKRLAIEFTTTDSGSPDFGILSALAQTFYLVDILAEIRKDSFFPIPRTDSAIVRLTPRDPQDSGTLQDFVLRRMFLGENRSPTVRSVLKDGIVEYDEHAKFGNLSKREYHRRSRRDLKSQLKELVGFYEAPKEEDTRSRQDLLVKAQSRALRSIAQMDIPSEILDKPFRNLSISELRVLVAALASN